MAADNMHENLVKSLNIDCSVRSIPEICSWTDTPTYTQTDTLTTVLRSYHAQLAYFVIVVVIRPIAKSAMAAGCFSVVRLFVKTRRFYMAFVHNFCVYGLYG